MASKPGNNPQSCKIYGQSGEVRWIKFIRTDEGLRVFYKEEWAYGTFRVRGKDIRRLRDWLTRYIEVNHEAQTKAARRRGDD
jgi:hypothetical protein